MPVLPPSICILDDDTSVRSSIGRLLASDGLEALAFERPEQFLAHAHRQAVALAVLDVCLPEMGGLEVQERLHAFSPKTRVIVLTGRDEPRIRAAALAGGASAFFTKPFDDEAFLTAVHRALPQLA